MKPSRPISARHGIALLIITVTCHTACASLLELKSFRLDNEEQNLSVRPTELFKVDSGEGLWARLTEKHQKQLNQTEMMRNYMASAWQQQTLEELFVRYGGQSLLAVKSPFKRHPGIYRLGCLSMIYNKTLLRASYICNTSEISP
jgi:hypothetical protein